MTTKLCTIPYDKPISELGGIRGPISRPTQISIDKIISMINRGIPVYEVNPKNVNQKVLLTFSNVNRVVFSNPSSVKKDVVPTTQELPKSRRNTVVAPFSEVEQMKKEKKEAKEKQGEIPVIKSDF